jgi:hypothetical protein
LLSVWLRLLPVDGEYLGPVEFKGPVGVREFQGQGDHAGPGLVKGLDTESDGTPTGAQWIIKPAVSSDLQKERLRCEMEKLGNEGGPVNRNGSVGPRDETEADLDLDIL